MIRVAVSAKEVLELIWGMAKPADRLKDGCLLTREPGIDECQSVVAKSNIGDPPSEALSRPQPTLQ